MSQATCRTYRDTLLIFALVLLAALEGRHRTGEGCRLDIAQVEGAVPLLAPQLLDFQLCGNVATAQGNFTDPDSRIMKCGSSGFEQCYNTQIAVDAAEQLIVATGVTQKGSDYEELIPLLDEVERVTGRPEKVLADAGYRSESNLAALEDRGIDGFVALGRERSAATGVKLDENATHRMAKKMKTAPGQKQYRKRKYLAEPPFAWIKSVMGFDRFSLRGLGKVSGEWDLACLAANLRRMHRKMVWT